MIYDEGYVSYIVNEMWFGTQPRWIDDGEGRESLWSRTHLEWCDFVEIWDTSSGGGLTPP